MSTATYSDAIAEARAARDAAFDQVNDADRDDVEKTYIDRVIDAAAAEGRPFSANDLREDLADVPGALIGARFQHAHNNRKVIRPVGWEISTKKNTHAKPVGQWLGVPKNLQETR